MRTKDEVIAELAANLEEALPYMQSCLFNNDDMGGETVDYLACLIADMKASIVEARNLLG